MISGLSITCASNIINNMTLGPHCHVMSWGVQFVCVKQYAAADALRMIFWIVNWQLGSGDLAVGKW